MARILLVSKPLGPPWNDSSKNLVRDLALGLDRHDAVAFSRAGGAEFVGRARLEPLHPAERGGFSPALRENARVLARLFAGRRYDAWHFFFAPNPKTSRAARLAARVRRAPTVQTVCSVPSDGADLPSVLFGDRIVVLSRHTEARFLAAGIAPARVRRIAPAAPPLELPDPGRRAATRSALGLASEGPLVVYPGDLEFGSAARSMVEAHAELPRTATLALACRAKTADATRVEAELRALAARLGTAARVHFVGETRRILDLLGAADVVALPSSVAYAKMDYPLVLLEAMALGRPVVVAEKTPAAELTETGGALAVAPEVPVLAATLARLLADGAARSELGAAAREAARTHFARERMARDYELLYDELLS